MEDKSKKTKKAKVEPKNEINHPALDENGVKESILPKKEPAAEPTVSNPKGSIPKVEVPKKKEKVDDAPKEIPSIWKRAEAFDLGKEEAYVANVRRGTLLKVGMSLTFIPGATPTFRDALPNATDSRENGHILLPV